MKPTPTKLQELQQAALIAHSNYLRGWAPGKKNAEYDLWKEACSLVTDEIIKLVARAREAGLQYAVAYAYNPKEGGSSNGKYHLIVTAAEGLTLIRVQRQKGDALCKPAAKFWGLDLKDTSPSCPKCLAQLEKQLATLPAL